MRLHALPAEDAIDAGGARAVGIASPRRSTSPVKASRSPIARQVEPRSAIAIEDWLSRGRRQSRARSADCRPLSSRQAAIISERPEPSVLPSCSSVAIFFDLCVAGPPVEAPAGSTDRPCPLGSQHLAWRPSRSTFRASGAGVFLPGTAMAIGLVYTPRRAPPDRPSAAPTAVITMPAIPWRALHSARNTPWRPQWVTLRRAPADMHRLGAADGLILARFLP